jgi:hypothetical protein
MKNLDAAVPVIPVSDITGNLGSSGEQGLYRYNMLQSKGHWFPGTFATEDALAKVDASQAPAGMDGVGMLRETDRELHEPKP